MSLKSPRQKSGEFLALELCDIEATQTLAKRLAPMLRTGDIVALSGDLGTGKTTFARALIRIIDGSEIEVPSPTFTLVQTYDLSPLEIWHFDLYRLEAPDDTYELGIEEAFATGVSIIEWPDRLGSQIPANRLDITFAFDTSADARTVTIEGQGNWATRIKPLHDE